MKNKPPSKVIRLHCLDCMGGNRKLVEALAAYRASRKPLSLDALCIQGSQNSRKTTQSTNRLQIVDSGAITTLAATEAKRQEVSP